MTSLKSNRHDGDYHLLIQKILKETDPFPNLFFSPPSVTTSSNGTTNPIAYTNLSSTNELKNTDGGNDNDHEHDNDHVEQQEKREFGNTSINIFPTSTDYPPPATSTSINMTSVNPQLVEKMSHFLKLKEQGIHFNERLYTNIEFRNPNIYTKLMEFVGVNENASNFSPEMDIFSQPTLFPSFAYYDKINDAQRAVYESKQSGAISSSSTAISSTATNTTASSSKSSKIDFASASSTSHRPYHTSSSKKYSK